MEFKDLNQEQDEAQKHSRMSVLKNVSFDERKYEFDDRFKEASSIKDAHTLSELVKFAENDPKVEIEAKVLALTGDGMKRVKLDKKGFIEAFKRNQLNPNHTQAIRKFSESYDSFANDSDTSTANSGLVGDDFIPLLGGPFNKNLPYYDYLRMHALSFHAFHHDPLAKRIIHTIRDFTLGRGWRVDCKGKDEKEALALWRSFEEVNDLYSLINYAIVELATYGEIMLWKLPQNQTKISFDVAPSQKPKKGLLPRYRLIDPSTIWEIVTYPEDITRVLYYQQIFPTQFQIYPGTDQGEPVPTSKFISQQIPAHEVLHVKINSVSNEKRGRSILFPILGYLKRLRDSVTYSVISDQKNAAWSIDTTVEGSQTDINQYCSDQMAQGTIAPAGSEFVHTDKIKREYRSNQAAQGKGSPSFEWCLSMIAAGAGIPVNYFGTHLSGGQTRGSAVVATEPVAKMFEHYQFVLEQVLRRMASQLFKDFNLDADIEVTFPEIITQDRSQKLKDLSAAQMEGWITRERAATVAAKELGFTDYEYQLESEGIEKEKTTDPASQAPLSTPPQMGNQVSNTLNTDPKQDPLKPSAVTSDERRNIKKQDTQA